MSPRENNTFPSHSRDFIDALNYFEVPYLLIGGYAMGAYGHIRASDDLDILIEPTQENAVKMIQACIEYGIPEDQLKEEMFLVEKMIGIGQPPLRIEIIKHFGYQNFESAYTNKKVIKVDGLTLNVIGLDDLITLKKAAVRNRNMSRDQEDLSFLQKLKQFLKGSE